MAVGVRRQVNKTVVQPVNILEKKPQGLYAERLRKVVAAEDQIDAQFLGQGDVPVGTFPGYVGAAAEGCGLGKIVPRASGAYEDISGRSLRGILPEGLHGRAEDGFQLLRQFRACA